METKTKKHRQIDIKSRTNSDHFSRQAAPRATRDHQGLLSKDLLTSLGWDELHRGEGHHGTIVRAP